MKTKKFRIFITILYFVILTSYIGLSIYQNQNTESLSGEIIGTVVNTNEFYIKDSKQNNTIYLETIKLTSGKYVSVKVEDKESIHQKGDKVALYKINDAYSFTSKNVIDNQSYNMDVLFILMIVLIVYSWIWTIHYENCNLDNKNAICKYACFIMSMAAPVFILPLLW